MSHSPFLDMIGSQIVELAEIESTNLYAIQLLSKNRPHEGTVITAINQHGGKGQFGSKWESESGKNINLSIILYPTFINPDQQFFLSMAMSLAIQEAISIQIGDNVKIKWPNDVLVDKKKICGILIQNALSGKKIISSVIGIGINVNQTTFKDYEPKAISFVQKTGKEMSIIELQKTLLDRLNFYYGLLQLKKMVLIKEKYLTNLYGYNEWYEYSLANSQRVTGKIVDVKENGLLVMQIGLDMRSFGMKEIKIRL